MDDIDEPGGARRLHERLAALSRAAAEAVADARAALAVADDRDVCALTVAVEQAGRLVDGLRVAAAGEIHERSRPERGETALAFRFGHRRGSQLVERLTRVSQSEAARRVAVGTAVRASTTLDGAPLAPAHPVVADALENGTIGLDAAAVVVRCLDQAALAANPDPQHLFAAETALVESAGRCTADEVGVQARAWREALDPDGAEPRDERIRRKRAFRLGRERDGLTPFSGVLTPVDAALLRAAFDEADKRGAAPRFLSDVDRAAGMVVATDESGQTTVTLVDGRTREQRHYDVVTGLLGDGLRHTGNEPEGMKSNARVTAVITLDDLRSHTGVGRLDGVTEPVSASTVEQLVCSAGYAPILLGDSGEVLAFGRTRRTFSPAQVKALAVRDGGCVNCGAAPGWCDAHHVREWKAHDGPTDIDNGVLLCRECHTLIHQNAYKLRMVHGRPHMLAPPWVDPQQKWRPLASPRSSTLTALRRRSA
jgi:hypothetical protein